MSSSKVFKQDPHFTPTPLVRHNIPHVRPKPNPAPSEPAPVQESRPTPVPRPEQPAVPTARIEPEPAIDLEAIRQEAYNQGKADLAAQYQMELHQTVAAFAACCQKIDEQRKAMFQQGRTDLINLIILLCEKILGQELATPRNVIAATLQSALEQAIKSEEYYVTLHPEDLALAETRVPELIAAIRGLERIVFKTDDTMSRGGCLLESAVGSVDATIETQLASLKEFLNEEPLFEPVRDIATTGQSGEVETPPSPEP